MTALACLRIVIDQARPQAGGDVLAAMVSKVAGAFLETRWRWPRRHGEIAPYAFLLADPRATRLDANELVSLSEELTLKLFGTSGGGVSLATLEGEMDAVTRDWQGQRYRVEVVQGGFVWNGEKHASLSKIAREITGVRWNGSRFFGLREEAV